MKDRELREGFTTGTCAAAAALASALLLNGEHETECVEVTLPIGRVITVCIDECFFDGDAAVSSVIKDSGDDPDVTNGIKICARVSRIAKSEIVVTGGIGIGVVTRSGLQIKPGDYAINPVPLEQIKNTLKPFIKNNSGFYVEIFCPEGEKVALKTYNPKLGITGGISILGTTGVVKPMSEDAYKKTLSLKMSVISSEGGESAVMTPGNYGSSFIEANYRIDPDLVITTGNYIGYMIDEAVKFRIKNVLLIGHIGKLIKVAGGIFNTHSRTADCRSEIFAAHHTLFCGNGDLVRELMSANTTDDCVRIVKDPDFYGYICDTIKKRCSDYSYGEINFEVIIFNLECGILGRSANCDDMLKKVTIDEK